MALEDRLFELLQSQPGQKARELADQLGEDRGKVNSVLYSQLRGKVYQDRSYRWWPGRRQQVPAEGTAPIPTTPLARLCRYYLECITQDDQSGASVFASGRFGLDYVELQTHPLVEGQDLGCVFGNEAARELVGKVRRDRSGLALHLGYPVRLHKIRAKSGWEGVMVEPVFLYSFQEDPTNPHAPPSLGSRLPQLNFKAFGNLTNARGGDLMDEALLLLDQLGLSSVDEGSAPEPDELVQRLRELKPDWDWREEPNAANLVQSPQLPQVVEQGIYNRAILLVTKREPYTKGLETELAQLQSVSESQLAGTALGAWLKGEIPPASLPTERALIEALPLNSEQRQAIQRGLISPLTVVTGPPGTGKSQVVTSLLMNMAWQGKRVLFTSKNNKAVDVVEIRLNDMGPRPILLRMGRGEYQQKLCEYLTSLLGAQSTTQDEEEYKEALTRHQQLRTQCDQLDAEATRTIALRNKVDQLERSVEMSRTVFGNRLFTVLREIDGDQVADSVEAFQQVLEQALRWKQPWVVRICWPLVRTARYAMLPSAVQALAEVAQFLALKVPSSTPDDATASEWANFGEDLGERFEGFRQVQEYYRTLDALREVKSLEQVSREHTELVARLAENSRNLWERWLRLAPKRLTTEDRRLLGSYTSILQMMSGSAASTATGRTYAKYYQLSEKVTGLLPCWAVTSLSAKGRIPLEPGFFDLLVIDEASQCDIASVVPLLYRAKRVMVIGDPKQLRHISSLSERQDQQLLSRHELLDNHANWAYSVKSLFDLAASLCDSNDIVSLRDHHRSHADIIEFSNRHFYDGQLRVATKYERLRRTATAGPSVRWLDVAGRMTRPAGGGAVNEAEARAAVEEVRRLVVEQKYDGSIGVVSPFRAQANRIRELAFADRDLERRLMEMDFLADTVHRFQGDERDVMIFSPTISQGAHDGAFIFLRKTPNLFNVAVTRARAMLVIVGDRSAALNSGVDYLAKFAEYVSSLERERQRSSAPCADLGPAYPPVSKPERVSEWEHVLYRAIYSVGLRPIPQYDVEKYTLDFAVLDGQRKLNIEVDGERYHRNWDGELCRRDQIRNQRLIELGWDVMRFWVYQVRDDLSYCVAQVKQWTKDRSAMS